jgi:hypothetical protein
MSTPQVANTAYSLRRPTAPPMYYTDAGGWHVDHSKALRFSSAACALAIANQLRGASGVEIVFAPTLESTPA